ncbi:MAG: diacylglycerol kinase family protein [Burkholderiales bacterium]
MSNSVPVIINATAGGGCDDEFTAKLSAAFRAAGMEPRILPVRDPAQLLETVSSVLKEAPAVVVAGGGDGTQSAVASALAGSATALGVIPAGTLNHFAKDLGIPLEVEAAARVIAGGHTISVDIGEVNGRTFINNSSIGLYPDMVRRRTKQQERLGRGKWHAMFWATLTVLRRSPFLQVRLNLDATQFHCRTPFIFIGNNRYQMEGFSIGRRERLDCAELSLYVSNRRGRWGLLSLALRALFGRLHQAGDFVAETAQNITIESRHKRLLVAADGEIAAMDLPLAYKIRPAALRVIVAAPESPGPEAQGRA